jgi:hypothetical protein
MQLEQVHNGESDYETDRSQEELRLENEVSAMKEMLSTLTEQKLQFTMVVCVC